MTYDDIIDWSDDALPMELYDDFNSFVKDLEANFSRHGHYFPPETIKELAEEWENRFNEEVDRNTIREEELIAQVQQAPANQRTEIYRKSKLKPTRKRDVTNRLHRSGFTIGNQQRVRDMRQELARKQKKQDEYLKRKAQQQRKAKHDNVSKRQQRRQERKPKFQRRLSKKERKKRGKRR